MPAEDAVTQRLISAGIGRIRAIAMTTIADTGNCHHLRIDCATSSGLDRSACESKIDPFRKMNHSTATAHHFLLLMWP